MLRKATIILTSVIMISVVIISACAQPTPEKIIETVVVEVQGTPVVQERIITATPAPEQAQPPEPQPPAEESMGKVLRISGGAYDIPSIDPSHAVSVDEIQVIESTSLGLVRQNETTAEIELAMAASYDISADGTVYTFKLRPNVPWVKWDANQGQVVTVKDCEGNDRMVTADDFAYGILRTLDPATASEYAYVLTPYLVGANDYNSASLDDPDTLAELRSAVGVKVIDPQTIEYTFVAPAIYNLNLLGLWVAHAQPQWLIEGDDCTDARGERWTEAGLFEGYGPFTLKEWFHDYYMTLVKNPFWPGTDEVPVAKIDEIRLTFMEVSTAFAEFEAGNLDISGIPTGDMDRVTNDPVYKDMIEQVYTLGTEFYSFQTKLPPTDDVRVRKALSLAIDRQALVENVVKTGIPAPFFTNPGVAGGPKPEKYPDLGVKYDPEQAKTLLDEYATEMGTTADQLAFTLMFNTTESNKRVAEAIQAMWKENLGIEVQLLNQERKVYYAQRSEGKENIYRSSWVQDYPDANNFLFEVFGPGAGYQSVVKWDSGEAYDKFVELLKQAAVEEDPDKRMDLYAQADKILVEEQAIITPLWWYSSPVLVQPYIQDTLSITGYDHWEKWDIVK
jgi:oligopeptide transport system substrate-binding protein